MTLDAETAAWSGKQGDDWGQTFTRATAGRTYDVASLLVQIRNRTTGALIATSEAGPAEGVLEIDTSDTDFTDVDAYVFAWAVTGTDDVAVSTDYVIEAQCEIDGKLRTFFSHSWECVAQFAEPTP